MNIWLAEMWRAWRASLHRPTFLLLATSVLALGVGASAGVFTLIDDVLLKPLPFAQPSQLVSVGRDVSSRVSSRAVSIEQYGHLQSLAGVSSIGLLAISISPANVTSGGQPEQVPSLRVDHGLLPTLGVSMTLGRGFSVDEDRPNGPKAVILGYGFWQRRYGGDVHVIGQRVPIEGVPHTIVGVLPPSFDLLDGEDLLLPLALSANSNDAGTNYLAIARLSPGAQLGAVSAQVAARMLALSTEKGGKQQDVHYDARPLHSILHADAREALVLFMASASLVLLIALVNLTNLMLLRSLARSHDAAVRAALGASRVRLVLPALAEALLVGLFGALAGLVLAWLGLLVLGRFIPAEWVGPTGLHMGSRVRLFALLVGLSGAVLAAALGLWRGRGGVVGMDGLREGGRSGMTRRSGLLGRTLVVAQVALAATLLCGAGLFLHALYNAAQTPLGFSGKGVLTFELAPAKAAYPDVLSLQVFADRVLERLRAQPGVDSAMVATNLPVGGELNLPVGVAGGEPVTVEFRGVSPGFFATFGIHLRSGRDFERADGRGGQVVAVVNQAFANQYMSGQPLGQQLHMDAGKLARASMQVVGVAADTRQFGPMQPAPAIVYIPLAQMPDPLMAMIREFLPLRFALRGQGDADSYRAGVHAALAQVDSQQPIANMQALSQVVRESTSDVRLNLTLVGVFAVLAMLLAAAGIYAVMAVAVASRAREFSVRTALGASPAQLTRMVLRGGFLQIGIGLALGISLALGLSGVFGTLMAQIGRDSIFDPLTIAGVCAVLATAGLLACLLPALRAGRVQPMHALRGE